jgi:tRNA acetyltransferase TAN1
MNNMDYDILIKTMLGFERIVANRIKELDPDAVVEPSPRGFKGLVLVKAGKYDRDKLIELISREVVEADKIMPIHYSSKADPMEICRVLEEGVGEYISSEETFAVRTTRRGRHNFTSIDVNVIVGDCVRKYTGASVNLRYPDKVVYVEIIQDKAYISILPGSFEYHKYAPEKKDVSRIFRKIAIIQMPFLGPIDSIREMGKRIGREVQNFEVRELVISPVGLVEAYPLSEFIRSVIDGIESRYRVQTRSYSRKPWKVPVYLMVQNLILFLILLFVLLQFHQLLYQIHLF